MLPELPNNTTHSIHFAEEVALDLLPAVGRQTWHILARFQVSGCSALKHIEYTSRLGPFERIQLPFARSA